MRNRYVEKVPTKFPHFLTMREKIRKMTPRKEVPYFIFCADLQQFNFVFFRILSAFVVLNLYSNDQTF